MDPNTKKGATKQGAWSSQKKKTSNLRISASFPDVLLIIVVLADHANLEGAKERLLKCCRLVDIVRDIVSDVQHWWSRLPRRLVKSSESLLSLHTATTFRSFGLLFDFVEIDELQSFWTIRDGTLPML